MKENDTHPADGMTLRQHTSANGETTGWTLFVTGWRVGTYKTEKNALRAVERWKAKLADSPAPPSQQSGGQ